MRYHDEPTFDAQYHKGTIDGSPWYEQKSTVQSGSKIIRRSDITRTNRTATGWREPTAYDVSHVERKFSMGGVVDVNVGQWGSSTEEWIGPCTWTPDYISILKSRLAPANSSEAYNLLTLKNLAKLRDQKVNLALTIGEMHKSIDTIASVALKLTSSFRKLRRADFVGALGALGITSKGRGKTFANTWLEMQYGIRPMMNDVFGIYGELTRQTRKHGWQIRTKSTHGLDDDEYSAYYPDGGVNANLPNNIQQHIGLNGKIRVERTYQQILWWEVDNPNLILASSIGLTNPAELIWEVIPWSFVVDWFLPVGQYLGALTADQGFKFLGGTQTTRTTYIGECELESKGPWTDGLQKHNLIIAGKMTHFEKTVARQVISLSPSFRPPGFKNPFSTEHALNALALLRSTR